jgi:hypothetical protein
MNGSIRGGMLLRFLRMDSLHWYYWYSGSGAPLFQHPTTKRRAQVRSRLQFMRRETRRWEQNGSRGSHGKKNAHAIWIILRKYTIFTLGEQNNDSCFVTYTVEGGRLALGQDSI